MNVQFKKSFEKDLRKIKDTELLTRIKAVILEIESAENLENISNIKKLTAKGFYYRIRVGDYQIGIIADDEAITFVRALHRKEIYRYFP